MLPESTVLGRLKIVEIYEFYQKPVLFACKNNTGHIYLAVWIDETDDNDVWLYTSVSPERFARMRHGEVDLHDIFTKSEDGIVLKVTVYKQSERISEITLIPLEDLDERWVPSPGDYVDIPDSLPRILWENLDQRERHVVSQDNSTTWELA